MKKQQPRFATKACQALFGLTVAFVSHAQAAPPHPGPLGHADREMGCSPIRGTWFYSGKGIPIEANGSRLTVNMSAFRRPNAIGRMVDDSQIEVDFPDDGIYTGTLDGQGQIRWSNGTVWQATLFAGKWHFEGQPGPAVIHVGNRLKIGMAAYGRPTALGTVIGPSTARVSFPDEGAHTATLVSPTCIQWSNGTVWTK